MNENLYKLHNEAMNLCELSLLALHNELNNESTELFKAAFYLEKQVAISLIDNISEDTEPSRSVLFFSAATMAYNANMYNDALEMINHAISIYTPDLIIKDICDLKETIQRRINDLQKEG